MVGAPFSFRSTSLPATDAELMEYDEVADSNYIPAEDSSKEYNDASFNSDPAFNRIPKKDNRSFPRHSSDSRLFEEGNSRSRPFDEIAGDGLEPKIKRANVGPEPDVKLGQKIFPLNAHAISASRPELAKTLEGVTDEATLFDFPLTELGGLSEQIRAVSEAILLPLRYPEVCGKLGIKASRGFLFHGPPGTGKTSVARALASEFSDPSKPLAYFQFTSSDILSKNVGESEAKLAGIFEAGKRWQPSILFFDEIDGLIPSRIDTDRPSASLVSTFLHLMDGMVKTGDMIVIGSTNRLSSLDDAMRRPGRFDEELYFPLPNLVGREAILKLTTAKWERPPSPSFLAELAQLTGGFSGADLKALCSRATVRALTRIHPSFLQNKPAAAAEICFAIQHEPNDFYDSMQTITPSAQRSLPFISRPLSVPAADLLLPTVQHVLDLILQPETTQHGLLGMPRVIILRGDDSIALQHVLSAVVHRLDSARISDLDHYSAYSLADRSGAATIQRQLTSLKDNERGLFLIRNVHSYFNDCSPKIAAAITIALRTPCSPGKVCFLATSNLSKNAYIELGPKSRQVIIDVDEISPLALDAFCRSFLDSSLSKSNDSLEPIPKQLRSGAIYCSPKAQISPRTKLADLDPEGMATCLTLLTKMLKDLPPTKLFEAAANLSFDEVYTFMDFVDRYS